MGLYFFMPKSSMLVATGISPSHDSAELQFLKATRIRGTCYRVRCWPGSPMCTLSSVAKGPGCLCSSRLAGAGPLWWWAREIGHSLSGRLLLYSHPEPMGAELGVQTGHSVEKFQAELAEWGQLAQGGQEASAPCKALKKLESREAKSTRVTGGLG